MCAQSILTQLKKQVHTK